MATNRKDKSTFNSGVSLEHRHFAFIAGVLAETKPPAHWADGNKLAHWESMVRSFADHCAGTNGRFNRSRFLAACGLEG